MDRRHGKRPLPSEASEEKEAGRDDDHPHHHAYESSWSETELSAMVSALTQVIGTGEDHNTDNPPPPVKQEPPDPSHLLPLQPQGTHSHLPTLHFIICYYSLLSLIHHISSINF